jgi:hypothetical protein
MMTVTVTLSVRVTRDEYEDLLALCDRNNVSRQDMLRAMIIDALAEEADALRCRESQGREGSGETSETCGAATS